ncbi:uncharacterized protein LOC125371208 [Ricinus communis]|uniref:uncharacterized protein LOC125371208 n=1 Tax=Ricinus communis TaxID=3988 RepID=UPI00201B0565|nr:uncharacterized protein LOC125371208 [Ricinus communis]
MDPETPKAIWDKLKETYEGGDRVKKAKLLTLKREFMMLQMKDDELIKDYSTRLMDIVNQIRLYGEKLPDEKVVEKVMINVPQRFEAKTSTIEESCDMTSLTISELISNSGKKFESSNKGKAIDSSTSGHNEKFPTCPICKRTNHAEKDYHFKDKDKSKFQCTFCKKAGHTKNFCWSKKKQAQQQVNANEENQEQGKHLFMVSHDAESFHNSIWLMDNGCTSHMTSVAAYFNSLDKSFKRNVKLGNGAMVQVQGKDQSLLSIPQMIKNGFGVQFKSDVCNIFDVCGSKFFALKMKNNSFYLKLDVECVHVCIAKADVTSLWHKRIGHFNLRTLKYMQSNGFVTDLPKLNVYDDKCDSVNLESHIGYQFLMMV